MNDILEVRHLVKRFGDVTAVDDLSFRVREGELFAFLGVNGAGKSTTIHILCGQLARDGGSVRVCGADPDEAPEQLRRSLGVVFQSSVLDQALSVQENLRSRAALYGIRGTAFSRRLAELTDLLELGELLRRPVGKLSGGQRRRIDIARALLQMNEEYRPALKSAGFLTRDPRMKERKKYGLKAARRAPQAGGESDGLPHHALYGGGCGRGLRCPARPRQDRGGGHAAAAEKHLCARYAHPLRRG